MLVMRVTAALMPSSASRTDSTLCTLPREISSPLPADLEALLAALRGCDTVIYDTHYVPDEYARFPHYGHSTPDHALELLAGNDVRRLILYHHAPSHDDDQMDQIAAEYRAKGAEVGIDVITACEGMVLTVGAVKGVAA